MKCSVWKWIKKTITQEYLMCQIYFLTKTSCNKRNSTINCLINTLAVYSNWWYNKMIKCKTAYDILLQYYMPQCFNFWIAHCVVQFHINWTRGDWYEVFPMQLYYNTFHQTNPQSWWQTTSKSFWLYHETLKNHHSCHWYLFSNMICFLNEYWY